jgi:hypothetical protein
MTFVYSLLEPTHQDVVSRFQHLKDNAQHIHHLGQTDMLGCEPNGKIECNDLARTDMLGCEPNEQNESTTWHEPT